MTEQIKRPVRTLGSSLILREELVPLWDVSEGYPVAAIVMDPLSLEFILDHLPVDDGFTKGLRELRDLAKDVWWGRAT